jgi:hypothetical protein
LRSFTEHRSLSWFGANPSEWVGAVNPIPDDFGVALTTVLFSGVAAGSEIRVYYQDGTEAAGIETSELNQTLSWSYFRPGSPNNTVRIVVANVAYKLKEFTYQTASGNQNLPVQQELDPWYSNPADISKG